LPPTIGVECRPDRRVHEIELLLVEVFLEIDDPAAAETGNRIAGSRIERHQSIPRRDVEDAFFLSVGPVGEPAARELARRRRPRAPFVLAVHPDQLTRRGVERDH
jgi:hypothetical protein